MLRDECTVPGSKQSLVSFLVWLDAAPKLESLKALPQHAGPGTWCPRAGAPRVLPSVIPLQALGCLARRAARYLSAACIPLRDC